MTNRSIVGAVVVLLALSACSDDADTSAAPDLAPITVTTLPPGVEIDELVAGDCLAAVPDASSGRVETVSCDLAHRAEVYGTHDLDDGGYPGVEPLNRTAARSCVALYEAYAGEPVDPTTDRAFAEIVPSEGSWSDGDRHVVCLALPPGGAPGEGSIVAPATPQSA